MAATIEAFGLAAAYGGGRRRVKALAGVDLAIAGGEIAGLVGPNGAGKSTLFACLLGFMRPEAGGVAILGRPPDDLAARAALGWLPERPTGEGQATGFELLRLHHGLSRGARRLREEEIRAGLARVGLGEDVASRPAITYSKGQRQRLGLALALVGRPRVLLLDEPTSGVDPAGVALLRGVLASLREEGVTVLLASHDLEEVERCADRIVFIRAGRIEGLETAARGGSVQRTLRVALPAGLAPPPDLDLHALAEGQGGRVLDARGGVLRILVPDDLAAARVLRALVLAGVPVAEAAPEQGRLERAYLATDAAAGQGDGRLEASP